jgi:hypothetical protein
VGLIRGLFGLLGQLGENAPNLGYASPADLAGVFVEAEVVLARLYEDQLLCHAMIISGGCDG